MSDFRVELSVSNRNQGSPGDPISLLANCLQTDMSNILHLLTDPVLLPHTIFF